jgi:DNA-binding MarR family transcriptional regulator
VERLAGLTSAQAWLITALSIKESAKVSDLARAMHLSPSAVVRVVSRLEERGLLVRTRSSNDYGIVKVALTHVARKLVGRIPWAPQELLLKGLSDIPPDRLRAVSQGLKSLVGILGARELTPRLFFAPVANLPAGASVDRKPIARGGSGSGHDPRERPARLRTMNRGKEEAA